MSCPCYNDEAIRSCEFVENIYKPMAYYGFRDIHFANNLAIGSHAEFQQCNWRIGVWTEGPGWRIMALKQCSTEDEATQWESPLGWNIADALTRSIEKLYKLKSRK